MSGLSTGTPQGFLVHENHGIISTGNNAVNTIYPALERGLPPAADTPCPSGTARFAPGGGAGRSFIGRKEELAAIARALGPEAPGNAHVLAGLGGVGKSSLADHHARQHAGRGALAWWVTADTPDRMETGLAALAHRLLPETALVPDTAAAYWAKTWLATHHGWLLVLDNVRASDDVAELCAALPHGRFLITSRRTTGWGRLAETTRLDVLPPGQSLILLTRLAGPGLSAEGGEDLCRELGHLPLAIRQAAAYLEQNQVTAAVYRERLAGGVLCWTSDGGDPRDTIARVWEVSLDRITEDHGALPGQVLRILSWLGPDDIPLDLLAWEGLDQQEVDEAIGRLSAYSLVSRTGTAASIHRLVQMVVRSAASNATEPGATQAAHQAAIAIRGMAPLFTSADFEYWPDLRRQLPHVRALAANTAPSDDNRAAGELYGIIGVFLIAHGSSAEAEVFLRRTLAVLEADDRANPEYDAEHARVSCALAQALMRTGNVHAAIETLEGALEQAEHRLGPTHRDTLAILSALGQAYRVTRRFEDAERALAAAVEGTRTSAGMDDPRAWVSALPLARLLAETGRAKAAVELVEPIVLHAQQTFDSAHPHVLVSQTALAEALSKAGDHERAVALLEEVVAATTASLGPDHIQTLAAHNALGISYVAAGSPGKAADAFQAALPVLERVDMDVTAAFQLRVNLATALFNQSRHAEAIPVFRDAIKLVEEQVDINLTTVTSVRMMLAQAHFHTGEPVVAVKLLDRCVADSTHLHGPDRIETIWARVLLASALSGTEDKERACAEWERSLADCERASISEPALLATVVSGLAKAYEVLPDPERAAATYQREAALHTAQHGPDDERRLTAARNAASCLVQAQSADFAAAAAEFERLLADHERVLGADAFGTLVLRVRVAQAHERAGNLPRALELHTQATAEVLRVQGSEHANVARSRAREDGVRRALGLPPQWDEQVESPATPAPMASNPSDAEADQAIGEPHRTPRRWFSRFRSQRH